MNGYYDSPVEADEVTFYAECSAEIDVAPENPDDDYDVRDCDFGGDITAFASGDTIRWTCPDCSADHTESAESLFGQDPDYGRDER